MEQPAERKSWWLYRNQFACTERDRSNWRNYAQVFVIFLLALVLLWLCASILQK